MAEAPHPPHPEAEDWQQVLVASTRAHSAHRLLPAHAAHLMRRRVACALVPDRTAITTVAPRRASSRAHTSPMPEVAPVTMAVLPRRSGMVAAAGLRQAAGVKLWPLLQGLAGQRALAVWLWLLPKSPAGKIGKG